MGTYSNRSNCASPFFAKQNNVATHRYIEAGEEDFVCKIQHRATRETYARRLIKVIGTRHHAFFNTKGLKIRIKVEDIFASL